jgi:hypothetical protein
VRTFTSSIRRKGLGVPEEGLTSALLVGPSFVLDHWLTTEEGYPTVAISIGCVKKAEKLIEEQGQIVAARWAHIAGLGSQAGWEGDVLHTWPTQRTQTQWDDAITFAALDAMLGE